MTSQIPMSTGTSTLASAPSTVTQSASVSDASVSSLNKTKPIESMNSPYQADQQVKFLYLQAEVETLLLQLQTLKQQRQDSPQPAFAGSCASEMSRQPVASSR